MLVLKLLSKLPVPLLYLLVLYAIIELLGFFSILNLISLVHVVHVFFDYLVYKTCVFLHFFNLKNYVASAQFFNNTCMLKCDLHALSLHSLLSLLI